MSATQQLPRADSPLAHALTYADSGWLVFPLRPRGKEPLTRNGYKDATGDRAIIERWWKKNPTANVALVTGRAGGIVVVDFDPRNGGDVHEFMRLYGDAFSGLRFGKVGTGGGGQHWYFRYPAEDFPSVKDVLPGVDIKSDGGYVVAPPSIHPSGEAYVWFE